MLLLPGEKSISSSQNNELQLTTHRIAKSVKRGSYREVTSIALSNLSSAKLRSWDPKFLLYIAIAIAVLGLLGSISEKSVGPFVGAITLTAICIGTYFALRREFFEFTAFGGEKIYTPAKAGFEACEHFLNQVQAAQALASGKISEMPQEKKAI